MISSAIKGLARYLYREKRLGAPITRPLPRLPHIYEQYLLDYQKNQQVDHSMLHVTRKVLSALSDYLQKENLDLAELKIGHVDNFLNTYNAPYAAQSRAHIRTCLRSFFRYLYHEKKILPKDLVLKIHGLVRKLPEAVENQLVSRCDDTTPEVKRIRARGQGRAMGTALGEYIPSGLVVLSLQRF